MNSLRNRFLLRTWIGGGIVLILFTFLLYGAMTHAVNLVAEENLLALAQSTVGQIKIVNNAITVTETEFRPGFPGSIPNNPLLPEPGRKPKQRLFIQIWDERGNDVYHSASLDDFRIPSDLPRQRHFQRIPYEGGDDLLMAWITFMMPDINTLQQNPATKINLVKPGSPGSYTLVAAVPSREADRLLLTLRNWLQGFAVLFLVIWTLLTNLFVRWIIQPINLIADEISKISGQDLSTPIPSADVPLEMQPVTDTFNLFLQRLNDAFTREKQFTADVSHELRTPLSAIRCGLDVMQMSACNNPAHAESLQEISSAVTQMQALTEDLLTLTKADSRQFDLLREPVDLNDVITETVAALHPLAFAKSIIVEWTPPPEEILVAGDVHWLSRLFSNLVMNAIHYNRPEGKIVITLEPVDSVVHIKISDTGIGISADAIPHIFERFFRADSSRNANQSGAGLGLSIVKWIIEAHNGTISATSEPGQGTTFTVCLPK